MTKQKPTIEIPEIFRGVDTAEAYKKIIEGTREDKAKKQKSKQKTPFQFKNANITLSDYVQVPGTGKVISKFELPGYNNLNWQNTHFRLHDNGLKMPIVPLFMTHFTNVVESYKSNGKQPLFDAAGNPVSANELKDIYLHLIKDHIAVYGNQKGVWTWLDAYFDERNDELYVLSEHRTHTDAQRNRILEPTKTEKLEDCINEDYEDCFVNLDFNSQGLPIQKSKKQNYKQGENIHFWHPENGKVARFDACSGRADLYCYGDPSNWYSDLGVFVVADAT